MMLATTLFNLSIISLKTNALKNILFRASSIALQFAILRFCAYIAYLKNEYTSFLMFTENIIQRSFFVLSRGMHRSAAIVLIFTIAFTSAGMYDTLLWALDFPGYVVRSEVVDGSAVTPYFLRNPSYVSIISDPDHDPEQIYADEIIASDLFIPGFNFSFIQNDYERTPKAIIPPPPMNITDSWGPRIHLDEDGFGVGFGPRLISDKDSCDASVDKDDSQYASWSCNISGEESGAFMNQPVGRPLLWLGDDWPTYLIPSDTDNPWASLSVAVYGTAAMKQVFTLTKGNKRHTFLQTTFAFSLYAPEDGKFAEDDITSLIQRSLTLFSGNSSLASTYSKACIDAQTNGTDIITRGLMFQNATYPAIALTSVDFINEMNGGTRESGLLHVSYTGIELFRSEEIPDPVQPATPCDGNTFNIATGGRIRSHPCFAKLPGAESGDFGGQVDTSAVVIITDVLGDGTSNATAAAFNQTGEQWYLDNRDQIDQSLLSRAFLVSGNEDLVRIAVLHNESAISYLQLLLIILPFAMALLTYALMLQDKRGYYKNSLFASLVTACSTEEAGAPKSVGYIINPPTLVALNSGIGTENGPILLAREKRFTDKDVEV